MPKANSVNIEGRVSFEKTFDKMQSFSLSHSRSKKNKETGEWENIGYANLDIKHFDMNNLVKNGDIVEIEGYFDINNEYTDKNGNKISKPSIIATSIKKVNFPKEEKTEEPKTEEPIDLSTIPF